MTSLERIEKLKNELSQKADWEERYKLIIERGKRLPPLDDSKKIEDYKVRGCQSQVWLVAHLDENQRVQFQADSDALIVKGLVAVLLEVYSGLTPDEILKTSGAFLKDLGFESHLSPSRANGLYAMVKQIMNYALGFQLILSRKK